MERMIPKAFLFLFLVVAGSSFAEEERPLNSPPSGFTSLFNGKDLKGWKGLVGNPKIRLEMSREQLADAQAKADARMRKHWKVQDGKMVVDATIMENYWEPEKPIYPSGQIELQNHGNKLYFRNIYIKELL